MVSVSDIDRGRVAYALSAVWKLKISESVLKRLPICEYIAVVVKTSFDDIIKFGACAGVEESPRDSVRFTKNDCVDEDSLAFQLFIPMLSLKIGE